MHHPEYQRKLQAELDKVVGTDKMPTLNDRNKMPMIEAIAMESQRYLTTGVVMAHLSNEDVNFEGYHIKKNTFVSIAVQPVLLLELFPHKRLLIVRL